MIELELRKQLVCYPFITGGHNLRSVLLEALRLSFLFPSWYTSPTCPFVTHTHTPSARFCIQREHEVVILRLWSLLNIIRSKSIHFPMNFVL